MKIPAQVLVEADLFISYLTQDKLEQNFSKVVEKAENEETEPLTSSEVYDDVISALRSQEVELEKVLGFVSDMRETRGLTPLPSPSTPRGAFRNRSSGAL